MVPDTGQIIDTVRNEKVKITPENRNHVNGKYFVFIMTENASLSANRAIQREIGSIVWEAVSGRKVPCGWHVVYKNGDTSDTRWCNLTLVKVA